MSASSPHASNHDCAVRDADLTLLWTSRRRGSSGPVIGLYSYIDSSTAKNEQHR